MTSTSDQQVTTVAAIDIGSYAIRMAVAEVSPQGEINLLEQLQRVVRLGQDTFRRGRLRASTIRSAIAVLRGFRELLNFYQVKQVRAVATSAVREAANSDAFLDQVFMATGLDVERIVTSEESRLTVSAVYQDFQPGSDKQHLPTLIANVGGGSTLLTLLEHGEIAESHGLGLGSIRLLEALPPLHFLPDSQTDLLYHQVAHQVTTLRNSMPLGKVERFIAMGREALFFARQVGTPIPGSSLYRVTPRKFFRFVHTCRQYGTEQLTRKFNLPLAEAETLNPALLVYQVLLQNTRAREIIVSQATMRDGLLLDLARQATGTEDEALNKGVIHSALALAEKFRADLKHARKVEEFALRLFDELQTRHGLNRRHRLLLQVAALIHDIGVFVHPRAHHKHSYYLIINSEIFGLTRNELEIVAHVGRYHRRSCPKPSHLEYMKLPREQRMIISKLSALLRVADALDTSHLQDIRSIRCEPKTEELVIHLDTAPDFLLPGQVIARKSDLFEEIYGLKVRLETEPPLRQGLSPGKPEN